MNSILMVTVLAQREHIEFKVDFSRGQSLQNSLFSKSGIEFYESTKS